MIFETVRTHAQLQSLAWTIPLVTMCMVVIWRVWPNFVTAVKKHYTERTEQDWIIIGIASAFIGKAADASWWFVPWSLAYIEHPAWASANSVGVFFNIIFRQAVITYAAYCHIRAFTATGEHQQLRTINTVFLASVLIGQMYPLFLEIIQHLNK